MFISHSHSEVVRSPQPPGHRFAFFVQGWYNFVVFSDHCIRGSQLSSKRRSFQCVVLIIFSQWRETMKILVIASEASPFLRTSTVADIVSSLCLQLRLRGHDVRLALPRYRSIQLGEEQAARIAGIEVPLGAYTRDAEILRLDAVFESAALPVYLVENDFYFDRDKAYGYLDDYERFIFFTRSVLEFILDQSTGESSWVPDLIHGHDWIAGLVPSWLRSPLAQGSLLESIAFVYTIHNAGFQGEVSSRAIRLAELENYGIYQSVGESTGTVNLMARGILAADAVNTVSVRHACEVEKGEYAEALRQALILSQNQLIGILNGFDYDRYDPAFDDEIVKFNSDRLSRRAENKKALQCMCQFETGPAVPLLGFAGRLITEKGLSLLEGALEQLLREEQVQVVIAGPVGDYRYRESFTQLQAQFPRQFAVFFGTDDLRSRRICAGADIVLIPSLYEPCGVHQMLAMRYGAIPVVHATGGLIDTVAPLSSDPIRDSGKGRGFLFDQPTSASLLAAVQSALDVYRNDTFLWHDLQQHNMGIRFSWQKAVREYEQLYKDALSASKSRPALEIGEAEQPDCHDLLVHAILEVEELSMATSRHTYLKAVARSVRELLESQAVLIWIEDENVPQRWRIGAHSFARGNGPSQPAFDPETLYQYAEEDSRSWRYVYQLDSGARQTQSQLGYLGSEVAQMEGWSVQLTAPMTTHGTVLGRIDVFDQRPDRRFTAWEMNALGALASALAANLDKSRRTAQREELLAADRAMAHAQTFEEIVQILLRCGKNLTHADTARLHLTDGNLHELDDGEGPTVQVEKTDSISAELKLSDGRILGQVAVLKALPGSFTAEDQMALTTLARQAANTIQAAHAREQRDRNRVQLLSRLSGALAGGQDLQTLMNNIVQTIAALLEAQAASLYLVDEHTNCLVIRAAFGKHAPLLKVMATYDIGEGVTGYIAEQGEILLASSIEELQAKVPAYKAKYVDVVGCMPNAFLGIPLIVHPGTSANRVVGVLKLEDRPPSPGRRSNLFSEDDVRSAEMVAQVIATVVYNAQVSDAQIRNISSNIGALSSALGGGKEMKVLLNDVVETIAQVLHADASSLYLINETTGKLVIQAAFGYQKVLVEKEA
ncbi:MAG: glycogen/starch synthase, partial [Anaerolineae bacterium]|nr:glycogen/starch synthase [Anaerolineae bacterium]